MNTVKPSRQPDGDGVPVSNDGVLLKLQLHSDPKLLCVVRGALERLTEVLGFSASDCRSITRAVDEALTNIIRHCYHGRLDQPIEVSCKRLPRRASSSEGLEILLSDRGPAVDPAKLRGRRLDEIKPGGLGLSATVASTVFAWSSIFSSRRSHPIVRTKEEHRADFRAARR